MTGPRVPCHHWGMSGDDSELPDGAVSLIQRGKARRFLFGILTFFSALILMSSHNMVPVARPLRLLLDALPLALIIGGAILQQSRPQGSDRALRPRNLRRLARLAGLPELGVMTMVYGCVVAALTLSIAAFFIEL